MNNLFLLEIIFSDKSCNIVTFHRNIYTNSSILKTFLYDMNYTFFMSQFTIVSIKL